MWHIRWCVATVEEAMDTYHNIGSNPDYRIWVRIWCFGTTHYAELLNPDGKISRGDPPPGDYEPYVL